MSDMSPNIPRIELTWRMTGLGGEHERLGGEGGASGRGGVSVWEGGRPNLEVDGN